MPQASAVHTARAARQGVLLFGQSRPDSTNSFPSQAVRGVCSPCCRGQGQGHCGAVQPRAVWGVQRARLVAVASLKSLAARHRWVSGSLLSTACPSAPGADPSRGQSHHLTCCALCRVPHSLGRVTGGCASDLSLLLNLSLLQRFYGTALGKGRQQAKTEIERLKLSELTCRQAVLELGRMCACRLFSCLAPSPTHPAPAAQHSCPCPALRRARAAFIYAASTRSTTRRTRPSSLSSRGCARSLGGAHLLFLLHIALSLVRLWTIARR